MLALLLLGQLVRPTIAAETGDWLTDLPKALVQAKSDKKMVFMDFTGSDWCPGCIDLHNKVLTKPEFAAYAKTNLVLMLVDFPQKGQQTEELKQENKALSEKYKVEGFPTLVVLGADGAVLGKIEGYSGESPKEFIAKIEKLKKL
ncbi:MAG: trxA [Pedosphaera sp.]|nr:trxA [Pedosphaera sp.]